MSFEEHTLNTPRLPLGVCGVFDFDFLCYVCIESIVSNLKEQIEQ